VVGGAGKTITRLRREMFADVFFAQIVNGQVSNHPGK
jgi:hypothetical protein